MHTLLDEKCKKNKNKNPRKDEAFSAQREAITNAVKESDHIPIPFILYGHENAWKTDSFWLCATKKRLDSAVSVSRQLLSLRNTSNYFFQPKSKEVEILVLLLVGNIFFSIKL